MGVAANRVVWAICAKAALGHKMLGKIAEFFGFLPESKAAAAIGNEWQRLQDAPRQEKTCSARLCRRRADACGQAG